MSSRPLKRSASVASLPTPPMTLHKRHNSRVHSDSDSESDQELDVSLGAKRRKTKQEDEQEESDFWNSSSAKADASDRQNSTSSNGVENANGERSSAPLLYRLKRTQSTGSQPLTPPPSHRKPSATASNRDSSPSPTSLLPRTPSPSGLCLPSTPVRRRDKSILRDSPENPFLASPAAPASSDSDCEQNEQEEAADDGVLVEKPTMEFVYRGTHRTYANPYYNRTPPPNSLLPVEHPDYEMDDRGGAMSYTRLFGVPKRKTKPTKARPPRTISNTNVVKETAIS